MEPFISLSGLSDCKVSVLLREYRLFILFVECLSWRIAFRHVCHPLYQCALCGIDAVSFLQEGKQNLSPIL